MDLATFQTIAQEQDLPNNLSPALTALWWDKQGDWDKAHEIVQNEGGRDAAWVHAYLHRKEGDDWNAGYWYRNAGRPVSRQTLADEWEEMVMAMLAKV